MLFVWGFADRFLDFLGLVLVCQWVWKFGKFYQRTIAPKLAQLMGKSVTEEI